LTGGSLGKQTRVLVVVAIVAVQVFAAALLFGTLLLDRPRREPAAVRLHRPHRR
jgi:hypothetical protein